MKLNYLSIFGLLILVFTSASIFSDEKFLEKETSVDDFKNLSQNDRVPASVNEDSKRSKTNPFFRSKYYRKKNSLLDPRYKSNRFERNYPTSRAYHPPIIEKDYLRQYRSDRRFENKKNFLRYREKQLKGDHAELLQEVDSEDFKKN